MLVVYFVEFLHFIFIPWKGTGYLSLPIRGKVAGPFIGEKAYVRKRRAAGTATDSRDPL